MKEAKTPIAVAEGDGIGPEIMQAALEIMQEANAPVEIHKVEIGEKVYLSGERAGIAPSTWDIIRKTKAFFKAPITTPQGGGFKSLNVTVRTSLGLFANIRPCISYHPFVGTKHPNMDVVIVRENEEDLYTGIEYRQTPETYHALKIISRTGCEKIIRYAFEYARSNGRKKVTCFTKDNILKLSDGLFHKIYDEISEDYPEIEKEHWIIDIGAAKLASFPEVFDVIVLPNLYGDILSDVAAQITGSVGLAGSANIGQAGAMFEAIHGSAPRHAGKNAANPSGLILASVMMLVHLGHTHSAATIHNAWLKTIEDGLHTYDIYKEGISKQKVGTREFAAAVIANLGKKPHTLKEASYKKANDVIGRSSPKLEEERKKKKESVGVDVYVESNGNLEGLKNALTQAAGELQLTMIANRGVMVWPHHMPETACIDTWRCRFMSKNRGAPVTKLQIAALIGNLAQANIDFLHTENLYTFDGQPGYTLAQDEQ